jgi:hypothetical protein
MADLGFDSRAALLAFIRQNVAFDSANLGKGFITNYNVKPNVLTGSTVLAPLSVTNAELAANSVRASKLFVPIARITGPAKAIPNGVITAYNLWNTAQQNAFEDGTLFFAGGAPDRVTARRTGVYYINVFWNWAGSALGERWTYVTVNAAGIWLDGRPPTAGGTSAGSISAITPLVNADFVGASFFQNAVANLNVTPEIQIAWVSN